jgi:hypothetical protein
MPVVIYCWRCRMKVPMLDEDEFARVCLDRSESGRLARYNKMTGFGETNLNAVYHHRLSLYGPPCPDCGKRLRTPKARFCAACGWISP